MDEENAVRGMRNYGEHGQQPLHVNAIDKARYGYDREESRSILNGEVWCGRINTLWDSIGMQPRHGGTLCATLLQLPVW